MPKNKLDQLSKQIFLKGFVPVILIIFAIVAMQYYFYASNELKNNQKNLSVIAQNLSTKIEGSNQFAVGLAETMAQAATNGLFGDRFNSSRFAKDVLTSHPTLTGAYFAYEKNADQSDALFLATVKNQLIARGLDQNGRFLPYWFRDETQQNSTTLAPLIDMESSLYYQGVKERFNIDKSAQYLVTEPYEYEGKLIVEQVFPIIIDGEFKGITGVDRALTDLVNLLKIESQNYGVDVFLISAQGRFISATIKQNTQLLTLSVEQTPYADLFASAVLNRNADWFKKAIDPFEQTEYFYTSSNVKTGNWLVIVRKSKDQVTGMIWQTAAILLSLSLIGLVVSGWLIYRVLRRTSLRINLALNAANELAKGEIPQAEHIRASGNDEVSLLLNAFNQVVEHYKNIETACQKMAEGDFDSQITQHSDQDVLSKSLNALANKLKMSEKGMLQAMHLTEQAGLAKSQFLANMSHEIRTPMNAVLGLSRLCLNTQLNEQQRDYVQKIHSSGRSLLNIINDILDFSKIESGKLALENTPFTLETIFDNLSSVAMPNAHQKDLELLFNVPYDASVFMGDSLRLGQILINLTSNAIKFTEQGEVIVQVSLTPQQNKRVLVTFEVTDQGIGMSDDQQQKLFNAFTQAESSTTRRYGGTGLGLAICKNLVELMGGEIHISSQLGIGTKVTVSIEFEELQDSENTLQRNIPEALRNSRILVVDDSETARFIIQQQLHRLSLACDVVGSGPEAIKKLKNQANNAPYNLVLMDWKMPEMDGLQAARLIQSNPSIAQITTVLMVTAYYGENAANLFAQNGFSRFLKKPISDTELYRMLLDCVESPTDAFPSIEEKWQLSKGNKLAGAHLLIAEDNLINQEITSEFLNQAGITYDIANNGGEAISRVQNTSYDGILMDLQMPIMGGIEATEIIRTMPQGQDLPIIAMTANAMQQHKNACFDAGMDAHISKPIEVDEFYAVLEQYIKVRIRAADDEDNLGHMSASNNLDLRAVDYASALSHSTNDIDNMITLLSIFKNSYQDKHSVFEEAIANDIHDETIKIAHSIAGVADYVGAAKLAKLSKNYEYYVVENDPDGQLKLLKAFYNELTQVLLDINTILQRHKTLQSQNSVPQHIISQEQSEPFNNSITPSSSDLVQSNSMHTPHILIADDDPVNSAILSGLLINEYTITMAENGQEALNQIEQNIPDLILLDIHMPVLDGYQVCKTLQQHSKTADIPIIFLTAQGSMNEAKCLGLGAVDFLTKPYVNEVIKARVSLHLLLKQKSDFLLSKVLTDSLTQVANQRGFNKKLAEELTRAKREKTSLSIIMLDLDKFNDFEDFYGHLAGEQCLQKVASFLSLNLKRPADFIARMDTAKFAAIIPNTPLDGALVLANNLRSCIESLAIEHNSSSYNVVTASIGVVTVEMQTPPDMAVITANDLVKQADTKLHQAQEDGGNKIKGDLFIAN